MEGCGSVRSVGLCIRTISSRLDSQPDLINADGKWHIRFALGNPGPQGRDHLTLCVAAKWASMTLGSVEADIGPGLGTR
jgi:hypothetical protein